MAAPAYRTSAAGGSSSGTSNRTATITPAVGDLLLVFCNVAANTQSAPTCSDGNTGGTYDLVDCLSFDDGGGTPINHRFSVFIRQNSVPNTTSTTVTVNTGSNTAGEVFVVAISGMARFGSGAIRSKGSQSNQAAGGTPAPALNIAALTGNVTVGCVANCATAASMTAPTNWTERQDAAQTNDPVGLEVVTRDSGFTGTTVTWGSTSATKFASHILELDGTSPVVGTSDGTGTATGDLKGTGALAGTSAGTGTATASGSATVAATGTAAGVGTAAGTLSLVGTSAGVGAATGDLKGSGALAGTSAGVGTSSGAITGQAPIVGTSDGVSTAAASIVGYAAIDGTLAGVSAAAGDISGSGALAGVSTGAGSSTGALAGAGALAGDGTAIGSSSGAISGTGALAGVSASLASAAGLLIGEAPIAGTATAVGSASGDGDVAAPGEVFGTGSAIASASGTLSAEASIAGSASGTGTAAAMLGGSAELLAMAAAIALVVGSLTGTGALAGTAAVTTAAHGLATDLAHSPPVVVATQRSTIGDTGTMQHGSVLPVTHDAADVGTNTHQDRNTIERPS